MAKLFGHNSNYKLPFVSVVLPAYNEEELLGKTLETIVNQDYAGRFEIVVADNNSTDRTAEIASAYECRVINVAEKGSRFAYQAAMANAKGDPIVVTNADVIIPKNWLTRIVETYLEDPEIIGVGTRIKFHDCPEYVNKFLNFTNYRLSGKEGSFWGLSMSSTKEAFQAVGGINHGYNTNEDGIFYLLLKRKGKVKIIHDVIVSASGRRFNGNIFQNLHSWWNSIGFNSIYIMAQYALTGHIKGLIVDFKDVRPEEKLRNNYGLLQTDTGMQKRIDRLLGNFAGLMDSTKNVNKRVGERLKKAGTGMQTGVKNSAKFISSSAKSINKAIRETITEIKAEE